MHENTTKLLYRAAELKDRYSYYDGERILSHAGALAEVLAIAKQLANNPTLEQVAADPDNTPIPTDCMARACIVEDLAAATNKSNVFSYMDYIRRMHSEYSAMYAKEMQKREISELMDISEFVGASLLKEGK